MIRSLDYEAVGNSRNVATGAVNSTADQSLIADSQALGYTGHINLAALGLVHMGRRVYDPAIGRFLSADPNVQAPLDSQSYDRYSYTLNNPLSLTDPSGYFSFGQVVEVAAIVAASVVTFGAVDAALAAYGAEAYVAASMAAGAVAGFLSTPGDLGDRLGGALGYGLAGGMTSGLAGATMIGSEAAIPLEEEVAAQGLAGGLLSEAGGGRFGDGFLGGAIGALTGLIPLSNNIWVQTVESATIGGTVSEIAGGNFGNGAESAAFTALFKALDAEGNDRSDDPDKASQVQVKGVSDGEARANVAAAWADFEAMYKAGLLQGLGYGYLGTYYKGLDDPAVQPHYIGAYEFTRDGRQELGYADIYTATGIFILRGGANSVPDALNTIAHEEWHLNPENFKMVEEGGSADLWAEHDAVLQARLVVEMYYDWNKIPNHQ